MNECARGCKAANTGYPYMNIAFAPVGIMLQLLTLKDALVLLRWTAANMTAAAPVHCPNHTGRCACCAADGCAYAAGNDCIASRPRWEPELCPALNEVCTGA